MGSFAETYNDPAFVAIESRKRAMEYINADDVIVFFPYILNEIKEKRSYANQMQLKVLFGRKSHGRPDF